MDVIIGSNIFHNTNAVIEVNGKKQIWLEIDQKTTELLLTMDIYNSSKKKIAKLIKNALAFDKGKIYDTSSSPNSLKLFNKKTGQIVVEAIALEKYKIEIPQGKFYSSKGKLLEITPRYFKISGLTVSGNVLDSGGKAIGIS